MGNHDGPEIIDPEIRGRDHGMLRTKMDQVKRQETTTRKFHTTGSRIAPRPAVRGPRLWPSANSFFDDEWGTAENMKQDFGVRPDQRHLPAAVGTPHLRPMTTTHVLCVHLVAPCLRAMAKRCLRVRPSGRT